MTHIPRPDPYLPVADILDDGEDVSHIVDRALVLRAVNSSIATEQALGRLTAEVASVRSDMSRWRDSMRPKMESFNDAEQFVADERATRAGRAKAIRKLVMAALLGAAGAIGAMAGAGALRDCVSRAVPIHSAP